MILDITPEMGLNLQMSLKTRNRIAAVGVELEGAWHNPKFDLHRDTSVQVPNPHGWTVAHQREWDQAYYAGDRETQKRLMAIREKAMTFTTGEYPTPPFEHFKDLAAEVTVRYPDIVNDTCGLHVHMSFLSEGYYQTLMDPAYPASILKYLAEWGHEQSLPPNHSLWARLRGEKAYCKRVFCDSEQIKRRSKDYDRDRKDSRYTVVAYHWARLQTIECRVLPMFETAKMALDAIERVLKITNVFLVARKFQTSIHGSISPDGQTSLTAQGAPYDVRHCRVPKRSDLRGERGALLQEELRRGGDRLDREDEGPTFGAVEERPRTGRNR